MQWLSKDKISGLADDRGPYCFEHSAQKDDTDASKFFISYKALKKPKASLT